MKTINELTDKDCIHCRTQEEWHKIAMLLRGEKFETEYANGINCIRRVQDVTYMYRLDTATRVGYTIHPASDFLTPTVSVLTEIGEYKVIKHKGGCIVIKDDKAMTLTEDIVNWIKEMK